MGRYLGATCKLCRREKEKLFLKGEKCFSQKCPIEKGRKFPPGQHGKKQTKISEYGKRLREKQKLKRIMGINEEQLKKYFEIARKQKGLVGENLLELLETRLDNVVYRVGWALSRKFARQLVSHKHILVNGRTVNIPSYQVKIGDKIQLKNGMKDNIYVQKAQERAVNISKWIKYDPETNTAEILSMPTREDISLPINELLIVEFYSK
jgi:small subunit ribosomal protein S4